MTAQVNLLRTALATFVIAQGAPAQKESGGSLVPVQVGERWGYADEKGHLRIAPQFEQALVFSEGLACVRVGGKYGYVDHDGHLVIEPRYRMACRFSDGLALVAAQSGDGLEGRYINKSGTDTSKEGLIVHPKKAKGEKARK